MSNSSLDKFDDLLKDPSEYAAITLRQWMEPVEGKDAIIFPPTYPIEKESTGYNIDYFGDGTSVCQIDSVGSQSNRMEPIFKIDKYRHLVPQIIIKTKKSDINLLDAGHRAADAVVRFSTIDTEDGRLFNAFSQFGEGKAESLARIAPTSIVFGSWDSRVTRVKIPRIVRSVIRAYNVKEIHRSAQYQTIAGDIIADEGEAEVAVKGPKAELGLAHVPSVRTMGGVQVLGDIRRDALLNLTMLRRLRSESGNEDDNAKLRRYILGLALVSITAPMDPHLREGCMLVKSREKEETWNIVKYDGERTLFSLSHEDALDYASLCAKEFKVENEQQIYEFRADLARKVIGMKEENRKKMLRSGPVTEAKINQFEKGNKKPEQ